MINLGIPKHWNPSYFNNVNTFTSVVTSILVIAAVTVIVMAIKGTIFNKR